VKGAPHINLLKTNTVVAVEVVFGTAESREFQHVTVKRSGSKLDIKQVGTAVESLAELKKQTGTQQPLVLVLNGKGIIHKKVNAKGNDAAMLNEVLPNAQLEDFGVQQYFSDPHTFVSIVRKTVLDTILQECTALGFRVVEVVLGAFSLSSIKSFVAPNEDELHIAQHQLSFSNGLPETYATSEIKQQGNYKIDQEELPAIVMTAFAAGFEHLFLPSAKSTVDHAALVVNRKEQKQKKIFELAGWSVLIFFFSLLLANLFVNEHYTEKQNTLNQELGENENKLAQLSSLKEQVNKKAAFIESSGLRQSTKLSWYSDQIALSVPQRIQLTNMELSPLMQKIKEKEQINFNSNVIRLSGVAEQSTILNDWIKTLKNNEWVSDVDINYNRTNTSSPGKFQLKIKMNT
jgi:Tfp pilus assembly protein PilN